MYALADQDDENETDNLDLRQSVEAQSVHSDCRQAFTLVGKPK